MKAIRAVTYGSVMAAALAAALPVNADVSKADRVGTPWHVVVPADHFLPAQAPAPAVLVTQEGLIRNVQASPAEPSAAAGAGVPSSTVTLVPDNKAMPDRGYIISRSGRPWVNVNWGDIVNFDIRDPNGVGRTVRHRFDGMDNVVGYGDIDPASTWAHNIKIYVNQAHNPLHASVSE
jgi:hypothetical protein